ncbi:hypothetical protein RB195_007005 [Necator americanus]|uniref:Pao retrotransposon peptidase n=2 Tax=Necator americanus TaxID=51031 RepID=A0ABR1BYU0_NECAM
MVLSRFKGEKLETLKAPDDESPPTYAKECRRRLREGIGAIETCTARIEQLLQDYASTLDNMDTPQKESADFEENSLKAEDVLFSAFDYTVLLQARVKAFSSFAIASTVRTTRIGIDSESVSGTKKLELPTLPIPVFNGNIWEWDNFCTLYNADVHSQPMPDLFKLNYLLNALKGEALNAVKKFQVTADNYVKALEFLKRTKGEKPPSNPQDKHAFSPPSKKKETSVVKTTPKTRPTPKINHLSEKESKTKKWRFVDYQDNQMKIPVLLDTGAFGSEQIQENISRKVPLEIWDEDGQPYTLQLLTHEILTKSFTTAPVLKEDVAFINPRRLPIKLTEQQSTTKPLILLGCDQLWPLIRDDQPHIRLPSGLHLLPTRLSHLLTGQVQKANQITQIIDNLEEFHKWDRMWSLEAQVNAFSADISPDKTEDQELWEKYWSLEVEGTEEFGNSGKDIQSLIDKRVLENFMKTVEKREDDNRAIDVKRLISLWNSLQKNPELLEQYNGVSQEQLRLGIIEEVDEKIPTVGTRIHYIPHQAVLTRHKTTTKLRVVFDASTHYKNVFSLNDALHRGPVILPRLYGLLLHFRIGQVALSSDVEKAFLQIHTTHFHLDHYKKDIQLVTEIKDNLYVDNLLLTADTTEEAVRIYKRTKMIFNDLKMNLREFVSNKEEVMGAKDSKDRSSKKSLKILGIKWYTSTDQFEIACTVSLEKNVTKRTVASAITSIYDPKSWIIPLIHKAKIFLQSLWKDQLLWDTRLPIDRVREWESICSNIDGFRKTFPREVTTRFSEAVLIIFADASSEAIASCVYLRVQSRTSLLMGKGKLPSLKSSITMPKMELNAMTLAMRLTNSVLSQISSAVKVTKVIILSDSEIVLKWISRKPRPDIGPFIRNSVLEIQRTVSHMEGLGYPVQIGHIPSQLNPPDCATRGRDKEVFHKHFWWTGPPFLSQSMEYWNCAYKPIDIIDASDENPSSLTYSHHTVKEGHASSNVHENKTYIFINNKEINQ